MAYGRTYFDDADDSGRGHWPKSFTEGMTDAELAVMLPPYHPRLDRPVLQVETEDSEATAEGDGKGKEESSRTGTGKVAIEVQSRSARKKEFDREVFKTKYF